MKLTNKNETKLDPEIPHESMNRYDGLFYS